MNVERTVNGTKIELRTGKNASMTSEIFVNETLVGCDAIQINGCNNLFNELTKDRTGTKALYLKQFVETA